MTVAWGESAYLVAVTWMAKNGDTMSLTPKRRENGGERSHIGAYTSMYPSIILKHVVILWPRVEKSAIAELKRECDGNMVVEQETFTSTERSPRARMLW
jgi:hypothetical protein